MNTGLIFPGGDKTDGFSRACRNTGGITGFVCPRIAVRPDVGWGMSPDGPFGWRRTSLRAAWIPHFRQQHTMYPS